MVCLKKSASAALAAAMVVLSPGLQAHRAFAQFIEAPIVRTGPSTAAIPPIDPRLPPVAALPLARAGLVLPAVSIAGPAIQAAPTLRPISARAGAVASAPRRTAAALGQRSALVAREVRAAGPMADVRGEAAYGVGERVFAALLGRDGRGGANAVDPAARTAPSSRTEGRLEPAMPKASARNEPAVARGAIQPSAAGEPAAPESADNMPRWAAAALLIALGGAAIAGWAMLYSGFAEVVQAGESALRAGNAGWFFPGVMAIGMVRGRGGKANKPKVTDEEILSAARSVVASKGQPWSETEYNMGLYTTADSLRERGATEAQMKLYFDTCAAAPIRGGGFNPWSGD